MSSTTNTNNTIPYAPLPFPTHNTNTLDTSNLTCAFWGRSLPCRHGNHCRYAHYWHPAPYGPRLADMPCRDRRTGRSVAGRNQWNLQGWRSDEAARLRAEEEERERMRERAEEVERERQARRAEWFGFLSRENAREVERRRQEGLRRFFAGHRQGISGEELDKVAMEARDFQRRQRERWGPSPWEVSQNPRCPSSTGVHTSHRPELPPRCRRDSIDTISTLDLGEPLDRFSQIPSLTGSVSLSPSDSPSLSCAATYGTDTTTTIATDASPHPHIIIKPNALTTIQSTTHNTRSIPAQHQTNGYAIRSIAPILHHPKPKGLILPDDVIRWEDVRRWWEDPNSQNRIIGPHNRGIWMYPD